MENNKWVSVEDALPTIDDEVMDKLVCFDEPFFGGSTQEMAVAYYASEEGKWFSQLTGREVYHITHWRELPSPPKQTP